MKISDILRSNSIKIAIDAETKEHLLESMVELAYDPTKVLDKTQALKDVLEREEVMSTGVGKGIALPHAKSKSVLDSVASLAILKEPIDFDSLDGESVNIAFMLLGPENNVGLHLRLLSKVSRLMNNDSFRLQLLDCKQSEDVLKLFNSMEEL
ncbi:MAG: PTS sugar transporter subunit IIA [Candidatus Kapabacteria bacterium]|nr:PTS sugar transporter subunit IIA [Ignavibacteriota bacterium]MCW5884109.1 PTS sugar transporter subunit IIA [Candidatus Kapabacteria bacterium]